MTSPTPSPNPSASADLLKQAINVRPASEADVGFIFNSWLKSFQPAQPHVPGPVYFDFQHRVIEQLLKRSTVSVACNPTDVNQIYGYIVHEVIEGLPVVHYAYVKHTFRRTGVFKQLMHDVGSNGFYTHRLSATSKLAEKWRLIYNPYLVHT